jgi:hypothetical protein
MDTAQGTGIVLSVLIRVIRGQKNPGKKKLNRRQRRKQRSRGINNESLPPVFCILGFPSLPSVQKIRTIFMTQRTQSPDTEFTEARKGSASFMQTCFYSKMIFLKTTTQLSGRASVPSVGRAP